MNREESVLKDSRVVRDMFGSARDGFYEIRSFFDVVKRLRTKENQKYWAVTKGQLEETLYDVGRMVEDEIRESL